MTLIVALPDGTYFIAGGAHRESNLARQWSRWVLIHSTTEGVAGFGLATDPNLSAVLYDPAQPRHQRFSILGSTPVGQ